MYTCITLIIDCTYLFYFMCVYVLIVTVYLVLYLMLTDANILFHKKFLIDLFYDLLCQYLISKLSCVKETWYTVYSCKYVCVQCCSDYPRRAEELDSDWDIVLLYCVAQNFGRMLPYFDGKALTDLHSKSARVDG